MKKTKILLLNLIITIIASKSLFAAIQFAENPICRNIRLYSPIGNLESTIRNNIALINSQDEHGMCPLHYAARSRNPSLVTILIKNGANPNCLDIYQNTPLFYTFSSTCLIYPEDLQIAEFLIQNGININAANHLGETFLHKIVFHGNQSFFNLLIKHNANVTTACNDGTTTLMAACINHSPNEFITLIARGANINAKDKDGNTAESIAIKNKHFYVFDFLHKRKDTHDNDTIHQFHNYLSGARFATLHIECLLGDLNATEDAIKKGGINAQTVYGHTPLHIAAINKNSSIVDLLIKNGADKSIIDKDGKTALEYIAN